MPLRQRVEAIRQGLEDFINILLTKPETAGDEALCAFLQIPAVAALHGLVWMMAHMCARMSVRVSALVIHRQKQSRVDAHKREGALYMQT